MRYAITHDDVCVCPKGQHVRTGRKYLGLEACLACNGFIPRSELERERLALEKLAADALEEAESAQ